MRKNWVFVKLANATKGQAFVLVQSILVLVFSAQSLIFMLVILFIYFYFVRAI